MTRGFITIATGKRQYYKIAANLVQSYRYFSSSPLPFAIIAEEENEYTALFDDVIITNESTHSFLDKFLLLKLCPYDETIFIDSDSLAYGDLNEYWDFFKDATDFSATGVNVPVTQKEGVWYNIEDIGKYGNDLPYKTRIHAGVCFIRKSRSLDNLYADCIDIHNNYDTLHFHTCPNSIDECVLGVAMPINNMKAIPEKAHMLAAYPCLTYLKADILRGKLSYSTPWAGRTSDGILLHWGTNQTYQPLYRFNEECLHYLMTYVDAKPSFINDLMYRCGMRFWIIAIPYYVSYPFRRLASFIQKRLRRILKHG